MDERVHPKSLPPTVVAPSPMPTEPPGPGRWEDLDDRDNRCPACLHWWVNHGEAPDPGGCGAPTSTLDEHGIVITCGCPERPEPGSVWSEPLAREAARQAEHYDQPPRTS